MVRPAQPVKQYFNSYNSRAQFCQRVCVLTLSKLPNVRVSNLAQLITNLVSDVMITSQLKIIVLKIKFLKYRKRFLA